MLLPLVPDQRVYHTVLSLDLYSDVSPVWSRTSSYYNTPFIWNMLLNFGGRRLGWPLPPTRVC